LGNRILVVDDEASIRHLLKSAFVAQQYVVETAGTVVEALGRLYDFPFDLAIIDLMLPDVDGLQLAEAIRMLDPRTPIILITAYGTASFEGMASHPAISHYVHKPFELDLLMSLVHRYVPPPANRS